MIQFWRRLICRSSSRIALKIFLTRNNRIELDGGFAFQGHFSILYHQTAIAVSTLYCQF